MELLSRSEALDKTFEVKSTVPFGQPFEVDPQGAHKERDWQVWASRITCTVLSVASISVDMVSESHQS